MNHLHIVHGLVVAMPFACPELAPADPGAVPDAFVREGPVPAALAGAALRQETHEASTTAYLQRGGPRGASFLVEQGERILFERGSQCDEALLRHVLLYPAMAALLRQRGLLVLHASGVVSPDGAILVCGESGAGKSTTAAALTRLGWPLQTDDVSALRVGATGDIEVLAGARHAHLFEAASAALDLDTQGLIPHDWHRMKLAVPALVETVRSARRVRRIVQLERTADGALTVERVTGHAKLPLLLHGVYGPYLPDEIMARVGLIAQALQRVEMIRIARPDGDWTMDAVLAAISAERIGSSPGEPGGIVS